MDAYYNMIVIHDELLYEQLKLKDCVNINQLYTLILTGNPLKYVNTVFENLGQVISVRKYYNQMTNKAHNLLYFGCKSEMNTCNVCKDSVIKPVLKIQDAFTYKCPKHLNDVVSKADYYSYQLGKLYFENLYHHYYLFSHCELLNDVKCTIRDILFL
jgi:hypothetical protein